MDIASDLDPLETAEWRDAMEAVLKYGGPERANFISKLIAVARRRGAPVPYSANTPYLNTIPADQEARIPGDRAIERRIKSIIRWNAMAMVVRANKTPTSAATLRPSPRRPRSTKSALTTFFMRRRARNGDIIFFQGHATPGHVRPRLHRGRLSEEQLHNFRQELHGGGCRRIRTRG